MFDDRTPGIPRFALKTNQVHVHPLREACEATAKKKKKKKVDTYIHRYKKGVNSSGENKKG